MSQQYPGGFITKSPPVLNPAMGNAAPGVWTMDQVTQAIKNGTWPAYDPNFENVTLLLHGNGTNGAQNNTFLDSSTNNFTITRNGNTTQGTFSPYGSNWSNYFDGNADGFYVTGMSSSVSDFCLETWIYSGTSLASGTRVVCGEWGGVPGNLSLIRFSSGSLQINLANSTPLSVAYATHGFVADTWQHMAITRSGSTLRLFRNGTEVGSATFSTAVDFSKINVAAERNGAYNTECWLGYLSNFRVVTGSAVYTSNFTPPTAPLTAITNTGLLTCQSNSFVDNSASPKTITIGGTPSVQRFSPFSPTAAYSASTIGGSGYFDGTGDYLRIADAAALEVGSGNMTCEAWVYPTAFASGGGVLFSKWDAADVIGRNFSINIESTGALTPYINTTSGITYATTTATLRLNAWNHVAFVKNSTTYTTYINGVSAQSVTQTGSFANVSVPFSVGADGGTTAAFLIGNSYISDVRFLNGTAQYTSGFTPPTAPLTAITNTAVLMNFTNAGIIDNAMMNDLETVGNAQISTTQSKFGGSSMYFDGTGDYLTSNLATTNLCAFGTGDFTVEFWVYLAALPSSGNLMIFIDFRPTTTQGLYPTIYIDGTSKALRYFMDSADRISGSTTLSATTWYHVAVSRSGSSTKMFLNGTQEGSTFTDSNSYVCGALRPAIATSGYTLGGSALNGYIDDLRITKGVARYTANFTPQTSQWQDQ